MVDKTTAAIGAQGKSVPHKPTEGWCRSELERIGVRARGVKGMTLSVMLKKLGDLGYDVE